MTKYAEISGMAVETTEDGYRFGSCEIKLADHDFDVSLRLPNGDYIMVQFRVDGPSVDIILPTECETINWRGDDMEPAQLVKGSKNVHLSKQVCVCLPFDWIENES